MKVSPSTASRRAEESVEFVHKKFGFALPYSPESLLVVEAIVDKIKATGATEQQASGLLAGLGCYVGEVLAYPVSALDRFTPAPLLRAQREANRLAAKNVELRDELDHDEYRRGRRPPRRVTTS